MRIFHLLLMLMVVSAVEANHKKDAKLSLWLQTAITQNQQHSHRAGDTQDLLTTVFIQTSEPLSDEMLAEYGAKIYAELGDIAIISIPLGQLNNLTSNNTVERIEANGKAHLTMDVVPEIINLTPVYQQTQQHHAFTGEGVVVGIQDVGFDLTHPNFYSDASLGRYRIGAFWDQLASNDGGQETLPVGRAWTNGVDVLAQGCATDGRSENHGTHTTGTAAGSGYDSPYRGVAFGSDLCLVANAVTSDTIYIDQKDLYKYTTATDALGFKYIFDYADEQGKPCVASFSEGYTPYFDEEDRLYAEFLNRLTGPGRILVVSAGNENQELTHVVKPRGDAEAGAFVRSIHKQAVYRIKTDTPLTISIYGYQKADKQLVCTLHFNTADEWSDDEISSQLTIGEETIKVTISRYPSEFSAHTICQLQLSADKNLNEIGYYALALEGVDSEAEIFGSSTSALINRDIDTRWHAATSGSNILAPGYFDAAICVGATTHRPCITNIKGENVILREEEPGKISWYSSTGPAINGQIKPDITAPGTNVISSLSSYFLEENPQDLYWNVSHFDFGGRTYPWGGNSGTSMSTPIVAGTIALWLQANPRLTRDDIMGVLQRTSKKPESTLDYPNNLYGFGEIDAYRGLLDILGLTAIEALSLNQPAGVTMTINEGKLTVALPHSTTAPLTLTVYSTAGVQLMQTVIPANTVNFTIPMTAQTKGVYAVQLSGADFKGSQLIRL